MSAAPESLPFEVGRLKEENQEFKAQHRTISEEVHQLNIRLARIEVRMTIWAAIATAVPAITMILIHMFLKK